MEVRRSALLCYPAADIFDLIEAAEDYPKFLPWCSGVVILERDPTVVAARISIDYHGLRFAFTTRNPKRRPHWMGVRLQSGPFRVFEGEWHLTELAADSCKVEFSLRYEVGGALAGKLARRVFDGIIGSLVDAYARRADSVYGVRPALPAKGDKADPQPR